MCWNESPTTFNMYYIFFVGDVSSVVVVGCVTANIYHKINTTAGLSSIASLSLLVSMSMSGLGGRPLLARCGTGSGSSGTALSTLMPPYRYRRSSGSSGSRSLQGPASAVLERRRPSTTPPSRRQPSPNVTTIHETSTSSPVPADSSEDLLIVVDTPDSQQAATASSFLLIPDIPMIGQSRSDNVLSVSDRAIKSFNHATSNGFLHTT